MRSIAQTGQPNARYVFPLGQWFLEGIEDRHSFILTLKTADGFEVSFRIAQDTRRALGSTLQHDAEDAIDGDGEPTTREPGSDRARIFPELYRGDPVLVASAPQTH